MESSYRRRILLWPLLLIGLGAVLLLQNLGLLPTGIWAALAELWPVLLILIGLDMLLGRRSSGSVALVLLAGIAIVLAALTWGAVRARELHAGTTQNVVQTARGAESASVEVDFGAGRLTLAALNHSDHLMEGQIANAPGESMRQSYSLRGATGVLKLSQEQHGLWAPFLAARGGSAHWDIRLSAALPLSLDVGTGAGETSMDLSGLNLTGLELRTGVGKTQVVFPGSSAVRGSVKSGVGEVELVIPEGLPARITVRSGLANVRVSSGFGRAGSVYTTPGFRAEGDYVDLEVSAGVGSVTVR